MMQMYIAACCCGPKEKRKEEKRQREHRLSHDQPSHSSACSRWRRCCFLVSSLVVVVVIAATILADALFPDGDLDSLCRKRLAQDCALAHTRELFSGVDREHIAEARRQDGRLASVHSLATRRSTRRRAWGADVDKREPQAVRC